MKLKTHYHYIENEVIFMNLYIFQLFHFWFQ